MLKDFLSRLSASKSEVVKSGRYASGRAKAPAEAQTSVKKSRLQRMFLKRDLAQIYFPSVSARSALQHLRRAIKGDPQLRGELLRAGYKVRTHYFTQRQVRILDFYFG